VGVAVAARDSSGSGGCSAGSLSAPAGGGSIADMQDDAETVIWDRAVAGGGNEPRAGDLALTAVLKFSGVVNDGGVTQALAVLDGEAFRAASDGFRYFGEPDVADLVLSVWRQHEPGADGDDLPSQELEQRFELGYYAVDQRIGELLTARLRAAPEDFAPVRG
jgi:hypothetical protein